MNPFMVQLSKVVHEERLQSFSQLNEKNRPVWNGLPKPVFPNLRNSLNAFRQKLSTHSQLASTGSHIR